MFYVWKKSRGGNNGDWVCYLLGITIVGSDTPEWEDAIATTADGSVTAAETATRSSSKPIASTVFANTAAEATTAAVHNSCAIHRP